MKRLAFLVCATLGASLVSSAARAQDMLYGSYGSEVGADLVFVNETKPEVPKAPGTEDKGADDKGAEDDSTFDDLMKGGVGSKGSGGKGGGGLAYYADMEFFFARATRADGQQDGAGNDAQFDYDLSPRITLGALTDSGMGIRTRIWDYSHATNSTAGNRVIVDTLTADLEAFERIDLSCTTSMEWSAGVRYTDFISRRLPGPDNDNSEGWGGTFGLQLNRCLYGGEVYARARYSILHIKDGEFDFSVAGPEVDMVRSQTEIGLGYELCRDVFGVPTQLRAGYEWQLWENFSSNDVTGTTPVDVGFDGFVLGAAVTY